MTTGGGGKTQRERPDRQTTRVPHSRHTRARTHARTHYFARCFAVPRSRVGRVLRVQYSRDARTLYTRVPNISRRRFGRLPDAPPRLFFYSSPPRSPSRQPGAPDTRQSTAADRQPPPVSVTGVSVFCLVFFPAGHVYSSVNCNIYYDVNLLQNPAAKRQPNSINLLIIRRRFVRPVRTPENQTNRRFPDALTASASELRAPRYFPYNTIPE